MGLWLNDKQIQRIVSRLDFKFSDSGPNSGIEKIRSTTARMNRFNAGAAGLKLHKIARRMRIWGDAGGPNTTHSKRWWGFLKVLHSKANSAPGGGPDAAEDIKRYIKTALLGADCQSIKFAAVTGTDLRVVANASAIAEHTPTIDSSTFVSGDFPLFFHPVSTTPAVSRAASVRNIRNHRGLRCAGTIAIPGV